MKWKLRPNVIGLSLIVFGSSSVCEVRAQGCGDWSQLGEISPGPVARSSAAMAYDRARDVVVLFGGDPTGHGHVRGDTWEWDGLRWRQVATDGPGARRQAAMVYDSVRGGVLLYGGASEDNRIIYNDTWIWDGRRWTQLADSGPAPRFGHAMTFDEARGVAVLFGGAGGESLGMADTWEWNGADWTLVSEQGPEGRFEHAMTYDSSRGVSVLIGGIPRYGGTVSGTWEWDGVEWKMVAWGGPDGRTGHALAYDRARQVSLLYGGWRGELFRDTWYWTGTEWIQAGSDEARAAEEHSMVYSDSREAMILQGGFDGRSVLSETWEWQFDLLLRLQPQDQFVIGGGDAVFSVEVDATRPPAFQWRRNGIPLQNGPRVSGAKTDTLVISPALAEDEGWFDCIINGACGEVASRSARLEVVDPQLVISTNCPRGGVATLEWLNAYPSGRVALIFARSQGSHQIPPPFPCAGTVLGLGPELQQLAGVTNAGPGGDRVTDVTIGPAACGGYLQLLDVTTCSTSNVVRFE